ncbi:UNVERIFIED_CONTAM: Mothers against decapentaplegic 6 [Gekko kuhli]
MKLKAGTYALLKHLKERSLNSLLEAIKSHRGLPGGCILISHADKPCLATLPHLLLSKLFYWPDLQHLAKLKSLCECRSFSILPDMPSMCCSPYHFSCLCRPGVQHIISGCHGSCPPCACGKPSASSNWSVSTVTGGLKVITVQAEELQGH